MKARQCLLLLAAAIAVAGCASLKPRDFATPGVPPFDPEAYFTGHTQSWGVFENRAGEPSRYYTTDCVGKRDAAGDLILNQQFAFSDGTAQYRTWHVHRVDAHRFEAIANDTVGKATGEAYGNTFRWEYTIALKPGNPLSFVHARQWMYLPPGTQTLFTRVVITKLGVTVAEATESFRHLASQ